MADLFGSCGHQVEWNTSAVWWQSFNEGHDVWIYGVLCPQCFVRYRAQKEEPETIGLTITNAVPYCIEPEI